ncbi:MAG: UDP-2,3-diacylglucosamine diphosphatase [Burkholderiales bacterium]
MGRALFISDIHLSANEAGISRLFFRFLENQAAGASSLYILGDLFDAWAGDDDLDDPFNSEVVCSLKKLADSGVALYIMHGNRDFLMGRRFFEASGATHLPDPCLISACGGKILLTHGDALCTSDTEYQAFRRTVRAEAWQSAFLAQPLAARKEVIAQLRRQSEQMKQEKAVAIMDVDPAAVNILLTENSSTRMIHGHTHKPGRHEFVVDANSCERWVLGDWHENGALCIACEKDEIGFVDAGE